MLILILYKNNKTNNFKMNQINCLKINYINKVENLQVNNIKKHQNRKFNICRIKTIIYNMKIKS